MTGAGRMVDGGRLMKRRIGTAIAAALLAWGFVLPAGTASAAVSSTPAATPQIGGSPTAGSDGTIEVVRQITQCGTTMYAVGSFTQVRNPNSRTAITRNNAFAFRATAPYTVLPWNPNVNGQVDTVACGTDGSVFLGGTFTTAGGAANRNVAKVNATSGASMAFQLHPAGRIAHMEVVTDAGGVRHLLVGGYVTPYLRSVNPVTGANDNYVANVLPIAGTYQYPNVAPNATRVYNMTVAPNGRAVLMTGVFTSVHGQHHEQIFRVNLTRTRATLSGWTPRELFTHCMTREPFYAQDATFSTDMQRVFVATTGLKTAEEQAMPVSQRPSERSGPCDAAIAYPATETVFDGHTWINYFGCDSAFSVAADAATVFVGGHQRWQNARYVCTSRTSTDGGPGSVFQPGLSTMNTSNGAPQPGPDRGRGLGAADLLRTPAGLWVASDNQENTDSCAGEHGHMGICFLPG